MNLSAMEKWQGALLSTLSISLLPNFLLFFIPARYLKSRLGFLNVMNILLCFGAGGLLGDVFLHTIPHLLARGEDHDHHHSDEVVSDPSILSSIVSAVTSHDHEHLHHGFEGHENAHDHDHDHHGHNHHGHHVRELLQFDTHEHEHAQHSVSHHDDHHDHSGSIYIGILLLSGFLVFMSAERLASIYLRPSTKKKSSKGDKEKESDSSTFFFVFSKLAVPGWLNLLADVMHNFTDGIAIGASFASGKGLGAAAALSVMFHEIPHEISDFSILVESGLSKWEAIRAQFLTAIGAFLGTIIGLSAERNKDMETLMLAMTSGGFLYIATVSILPIVVSGGTGSHGGHSHGHTHDKKDDGGDDDQSATTSIVQVVLEALAFSAGVGFMVAVAYLE